MSSNQDYGIYLVTDPVLCGTRGVVETVRLAVDGGVQTVQLRDKNASFDQQLSQLDQLAAVIDGRAKLVINDRLDVAVEAQGVALPSPVCTLVKVTKRYAPRVTSSAPMPSSG